MSWLIRTGTGRNNIAWGGGSTNTGKYLRRTGTSRNNISYINISSANTSTYNLLERTSTGRNNIRWNNLTFNLKSGLMLYPLGTGGIGGSSGSRYNICMQLPCSVTLWPSNSYFWYLSVSQYLTNGYNLKRVTGSGVSAVVTTPRRIIIACNSSSDRSTLINVFNKFSTCRIVSSSNNITYTITDVRNSTFYYVTAFECILSGANTEYNSNPTSIYFS